MYPWYPSACSACVYKPLLQPGIPASATASVHSSGSCHGVHMHAYMCACEGRTHDKYSLKWAGTCCVSGVGPCQGVCTGRQPALPSAAIRRAIHHPPCHPLPSTAIRRHPLPSAVATCMRAAACRLRQRRLQSVLLYTVGATSSWQRGGMLS